MGRKKIALDLAKVERLAGLGLTHEEIARNLGVSLATITRRKRDSADFDEAIKRGQAAANATVANALMARVLIGDLGAIIWWEKTRAGRTDKQQQEHTGEVVIRVRYDDAND